MPLQSIDGLASGLNTTEIVDTMIEFERRNAVLIEQRQEETTNIITSLQALQAKTLALGTTLSALTRASSFEKGSVKSSNDSVLSVSSTGRIATGSYDFQVLSLARNHQIASQGFDSDSVGTLGTGTISVGVGDGSSKIINIDASNNSLVGIKQAINEADAGVTASIINDGSDKNSFRLVISASKTGLENSINISSNLTGASNLDFKNTSFDAPEMMLVDDNTTSTISLGTTAAYSGATNKTYTFTVNGTGEQILGTDPITINWSDGTNSGTIAVNLADDEVELVGAGADGLKLNFSAGSLHGGDTFQVQTFAPTLQEASDAKLSYGNSGGAGSAIVVTSKTNTFTDIVAGAELKVLKETALGETVTVSTAPDTEGIKNKIQAFIDKYNDVMKYIDEQNDYNADTGKSGVLIGDITTQIIQSSLRGLLGNRVEGLDSDFNQLYSIGIRTTANGGLRIDNPTRLNNAIEENLDDVIKLFTNTGNSSSSNIEFVSATAETRYDSNFDVRITQAATRGEYIGTAVSDPAGTPLVLDASNNRLKLKLDGVVSDEMLLSQRTYSSADDLVEELQAKIDNDKKIGGRGLTVEWVDDGSGNGHLQFQSSAYGSNSRVELDHGIINPSYEILGLSGGTKFTGNDVAGTINGEEAEGKGQVLSGKDDSETTAGLKLRVTFDESQVGEGVTGTVEIVRGVAARMKDQIDSLTRSTTGTFDSRIKGYQSQVEQMADRVEQIDERLALRRIYLLDKFLAMESALREMSSTAEFLSTQISGLNQNWVIGRGGNR